MPILSAPTLIAGLTILSAANATPLYEPVPTGFQRAVWKSDWISHANAPARGAVVLHLRKFIDLPAAPAHFVVHVSADNRYILHVNGKRVSVGPARGDLEHWRYATMDLAAHMQSGRNLIAATIWNFGGYAPIAQHSHQTAFVLQGDDDVAAVANTNKTWEASIDAGHAFTNTGIDPVRARFFYAAGPAERRVGQRWDWDWDSPSSRGAWAPATAVNRRASPRTVRDTRSSSLSPSVPMLVPDPLPPMEETPVSAGQVVRTAGPVVIKGPAESAGPWHFPANTHATVLLDRKILTNAYPQITVSGGSNATMRVHYSESLWTKEGGKGNRSEIADKEFFGIFDEFFPDGPKRTFSSLWWRSWRYLQIEVTTGSDPLVVDNVTALQTLFPFSLQARFDSDDAQLRQILDTAAWTLRISAWETYMDSPYWEQLQYVGDTRITALLSYILANDDRLARQAILAFDESRTADGLTFSRYPSHIAQYIPPYSLFWVGMVHDFFMYRDDTDFVRRRLAGTRTVMDWFLRRQRPDGLLHYIELWNHVDPVERESRQTEEGGSGAITTQFIEALAEAAALEKSLGDPGRAALYSKAEARARQGMQQLWDKDRGLYRDHPGSSEFSHDVNLMSLWLDVAPTSQRKAFADKVIAIGHQPPGRQSAPGQLEPASLYFRYYLHRAIDHVGRGDEFLSLLTAWREMLAMGLSTFPEHADPTRSDSHAWTAHPAFDLLTIAAGIRPAAPGFKRVTIKPHMATLKDLDARMPHPAGDIVVSYRVREGKLKAAVALPAGLPGTFLWAGRTHALPAGATTKLELPAGR